MVDKHNYYQVNHQARARRLINVVKMLLAHIFRNLQHIRDAQSTWQRDNRSVR